MEQEMYFVTKELRVGCLGYVDYKPKSTTWTKKKGNSYIAFESVPSDIFLGEMQGEDIFTGKRYNFFTGNNSRDNVLKLTHGDYAIGHSVPLESICEEKVVSASEIKLIVCKLNIYDVMNRTERTDTFYLLKKLAEDIELIESEDDYRYFVYKFIDIANKYCDTMMNQKDNSKLLDDLSMKTVNLNNELLDFKKNLKKRVKE